MEAETRLLLDIAFLTAVAGICSIVMVKLKFPPIIGYLIAGILLGPAVFSQISIDQSTVALLSSMGIVLLMFYIGLELNLRELRRMGSLAMMVTVISMTTMVIIGYIVGILIGLDPITSIFLGAIISGSSTAVVVGVMHSLGILNTKLARTAIVITVLEDVGQVIILTLAAPLLVGESPTLGSTFNMVLVILVFMALSIVLGATLIPKVINWIGRRYPGEVLLIVTVALCFAMALASSSIGLSIAIGAFLMGVIVSQSSFVQVIRSKVEPMKELFMAVFFISIGMQIDPAMILPGIVLALIIAATFVVAKTVSVSAAAYISGMEARSSFQIGIGMVAMGEFAFIIAKVALDAGQVDVGFYSSVIIAALITMVFLPVAARNTNRIYDGMMRVMPRQLLRYLWRFDAVKRDASKRFEAHAETRKRAKEEIMLISVDVVVIICIMLLINLLTGMSENLKGIAAGLNILPVFLLFLAGLILITPAVFNTMMGIRRMAAIVTHEPVEVGEGKGTGSHRYRVVRNVGDASLAIMLVLLFIPFVAMIEPELYTSLIFVIMTWLVIVFLIWNTYKRVYDRVRIRLNQNILEMEEETN
jgi:monovalent cation:H+ antiporter-2, CPA2 family